MSETTSDIVGLAIAIAVGFLVAVVFYRSMSTRDVLVRRVQRAAAAVSSRWWVRGASYAATVIVLIPVAIVVWIAVLESALVFVSPLDSIDDVAVRAVAIVTAVRILAYGNERVAGELAKAVPFALLFLLLTGADFEVDVRAEAMAGRDDLSVTDEMVIAAVGVELVLRLLTDGSHLALREVRRRRGVEGDLGAWRTLWAAVRGQRPLRGDRVDGAEG